MNVLTEQVKKIISGLSKTEKTILYIAVPLVSLALLDGLFLRPVTSKLSALDEEIDTQQDNIKKDYQFLQYKDKILKEKDGLRGFYTKKKQKDEEVMNEFLKKIEDFGREANILIRTTPSQTEQKKGYSIYAVSLDCTGKLKNIVTFMHFINSSDELLKITRYNVNAKKAGTEDISASMSIIKAVVESPDAGEVTVASAAVPSKPAQAPVANNQESKPTSAAAPAQTPAPGGKSSQ